MKIAIFLVFFLAGIGPAFAESDVVASISDSDSTLYVDRQIMITADVKNGQDVVQPFAYLTQVKNDEQVVISLSWLTGSLSPRQSFSPAQSWTPTEPGTYTIEVFVWESIDNPEALSSPLSMTVTVVHETA
ncbi:hypothetical protein NsoK4_03645 [Nitrosopumilus sp. K4]|uniref:hypothetical protein n=1 Tax=Nitrosopumilus sp. K4 TaxID=2795383 RepID=UPI001BA597D8|nr:hypothetical protein [Nitrosopumilus sp. K4]QUC65349.1 hypothetical protein NsoK4_03645 [Nitrosopumilus sp. K4]